MLPELLLYYGKEGRRKLLWVFLFDLSIFSWESRIQLSQLFSELDIMQ